MTYLSPCATQHTIAENPGGYNIYLELGDHPNKPVRNTLGTHLVFKHKYNVIGSPISHYNLNPANQITGTTGPSVEVSIKQAILTISFLDKAQ